MSAFDISKISILRSASWKEVQTILRCLVDMYRIDGNLILSEDNGDTYRIEILFADTQVVRERGFQDPGTALIWLVGVGTALNALER